MDRIYIDTNFLIDAVIGKDEEKSIQKRQLRKITKMPMQVHIPQIIVGECFAIITRKSNADDLKGNIYDLVEWIKTLVPDIGNCIPPIRLEVIKMANEIKNGDNRIDWTDAIFISHAIVDRDSRFVFTTDTKIQRSSIISTKIKARENDWPNLSVKDSVPGS